MDFTRIVIDLFKEIKLQLTSKFQSYLTLQSLFLNSIIIYPDYKLQILLSQDLLVHDGSNFVARAVAGWTVEVGCVGAGDGYGAEWGVAYGGAARDE